MLLYIYVYDELTLTASEMDVMARETSSTWSYERWVNNAMKCTYI